MAPVARERVDSPKNDRLKALARLHGRRARQREGRTLVEGVREVERAVTAGVPVDQAWLADGSAGPEAHALAGRLEASGVTIVEASEAAFGRLSRRQAPDGLIAVARPAATSLRDLALPHDPLLVVAVGSEKPGNLGALARSADAASADALIVVDDAGTDPWNPQVIRASMGSIFALTTAVGPTEVVLPWLTSRNVAIVATSPAAALELWDADLRGGVAIVLGPEDAGLDERWLEAADRRVCIPMGGAADSLNLSVTGALLLFEAIRQRRADGRTGRTTS